MIAITEPSIENIEQSDFLDALTHDFSVLALSVAKFVPPAVFGIVLAGLASYLIPTKQNRTDAFLQMVYVSFVGVGVAFIEVDLSKNFIKALLPSLVTVLLVLFQLIGRLKPDFESPIETKVGYVTAAIGIVMFLVSSEYFKTS